MYVIYVKNKNGSVSPHKNNVVTGCASDILCTGLFASKKDADIYLKSQIMYQALYYKNWKECMKDPGLKKYWVEESSKFEILEVKLQIVKH